MQRAVPTFVPNKLLAALPRRDYGRLARHLEPTVLTFGQMLYEPGKRIRHVYFPVDAVISLLSLAGPGKSAEIAMVGSEGVVGGFASLGIPVSHMQAVVQRSGSAMRMTSEQLHREFKGNGDWFRELFRFTHVLMNQAAQTAACNRFHKVEARLARWLLTTRDRFQSNHFHLTHEFLSLMVGARRGGITAAAISLQRRRLIAYTRGNIQILDPRHLEAASCACYRTTLDIQRSSQRA
jgi:CRP-like cAMP-binding protein